MRYLLLPLAIIPMTLQTGTSEICRNYARPIIQQKLDTSVQEKCLAVMIFGEARGEPELGQVAVAFTSVNRAKKGTLCQVILAPKQYSVFNNDPHLKSAATTLHILPIRKNPIDQKNWEQALHIAKKVIAKKVPDPTNGGTHYLSEKVMIQKGYTFPKWSSEFKLTATIANHKFYKQSERKHG